MLLCVSVNSLAQGKAVVYGNHISLGGRISDLDLKLSDRTEYQIRKYGRMRKRFFKRKPQGHLNLMEAACGY